MNYSEYVREFIKDIKIGQTIKVDLRDAPIASFRMTLRSVSGDKVFLTKMHVDGEYWIRREL